MTTSTVSRLGRAPEEGIKAPVITTSVINITLNGTGQTIGLPGVLVSTGQRVLAAAQTVPAENGIYIVGPNDWERASDMNADNDVSNGQLVLSNNNSLLYQTVVTGPWTPGSTPITFTELVGGMPASIVLTLPNPIDLVDTTVALNVGAADPDTEPHIEVDFQAIQSKADATTAAPLFLNPLGSYVQSPQFIAGDPGVETGGIIIDGVTYQSALKVSDLGGTNVAQLIMHRHHDTLPGILVGSRARGSTSSHDIVVDNDTLLSIMAVGWDGTDYKQGAQMRFQVDGVAAAGDMPGRITFLTAPAGTTAVVERMRIDQAGLVAMLFGLDVTGNIAVDGTVDGRDVSDDGGILDALVIAYNAHAGDATIHFTQAAISITASQVSDFDTEVSNNASVAANTAKATNVPTALSIGTHTIAVLNITSDGGADDVTLPSFTSTLSGVIPGSGGGTANFMRADGTWAAPPGTGGSNFTAVVETTTARTAAAFEAVFVDDDTAAGVVTITLPAGSADDQIVVKKLGTTANVIVDGDTAETIDGALTFTLTAQYASVTLMWNGTEWSII